MAEFYNHGILCASGDYPVEPLIRYYLNRKKWNDEIIGNHEIVVKAVTSIDDPDLQDFLLHDLNDIHTEYGISQDNRRFHQSSILKMMFKDGGDSIKKAIDGSMEIDHCSYAVFLMKLYGIKPF